LGQPRPLGGSQSPFTVGELISVIHLSGHQVSVEAMDPDGCGQLLQPFLIEFSPRLVRVGVDLLNRDLYDRRLCQPFDLQDPVQNIGAQSTLGGLGAYFRSSF
jgi:hypothetical protein